MRLPVQAVPPSLVPSGLLEHVLVTAVPGRAAFHTGQWGLLALSKDTRGQAIDLPSSPLAHTELLLVLPTHVSRFLAPQMAAVSLHPEQLPGTRHMEPGRGALVSLKFWHRPVLLPVPADPSLGRRSTALEVPL